MKHRLKNAFGFAAGTLLALATGSVAAQSNGPYYANPSWDQKLQCDTQATCPRFVVLTNWNSEAVLDRETGLVWERSPTTFPSPWEDQVSPSFVLGAQTRCNALLAAGNRMGWRLPTLQELASLVDQSVAAPGPTLPPGHPFQNVQQSLYWSATTYGADASIALGVVFNAGKVGGDAKTNSHFLWCVRGGQGVNPQ